MQNNHIENMPVVPKNIPARRRLMRYFVAATIILGQFTLPALALDRGSIKSANKAAPAAAKPKVAAQPRGATGNQNIIANKNTNINANKNTNINANKNTNINVDKDVNINVDRDIHGSINIDNDHNDHFWGGVAVGVASTLIVGAIVKDPPPNPQVIVVSGGPSVMYADGVYYQQGPSGYVVVPAPAGAAINDLPPGTETVSFNSVTYYYSGGVFYAKQGATFTVVNTPIGITVAALPPGATQTVVSGNAYFLFNGIHYKPVMQNGVTVYATVKL
jgi:hypothetical protein